jgi:hypothetical protein
LRTTILLGAGASVGAGIPPARELLVRALEDPHPWEELGVPEGRNLLRQLTERCERHWKGEEPPKTTFEIEALVNTVHALATRKDWWGHPFVAGWANLLGELETGAEALKTSYSPTMPLPYLEGTAKAGESIACGWNPGDEWQSPFAAFRSILLFVVTKLTTVAPEADRSRTAYLAPIIARWLNDPSTTVATLNYDNSLEIVAKEVGCEVDHGISDYTRTRRVRFNSGRLHLLKLHGSGSWAEQRVAGMHTGGEDFRYQPWHEVDNTYTNFRWAQPAIIMGGENKLQARGPFLELYMEFGNRLRDTQRLVVVGYSFRDPHINEAIRTWIRDTPRRNEPHLVVVDPSALSLAAASTPPTGPRCRPGSGVQPTRTASWT